ncbi:hypothetical protein [Flavobacterium sp. UBA7682]|uniref:hypothetical protein n=1 Tax=Flavobacterium sp. UBA7682 TaxID=1946560 RepID=UPI0025C659A2|nr:hypothetical protein [Flavobacterium sp. UBA7682]
MRKIYRYENLSYTGNKEEEIIFKIKFISDGNIGHTVINIPGDDDKEIANSGKSNLGKIDDLKKEKTISVSDIANPIPEEEDIIIEYYLNDILLVRHENPKSETDRPYVILKIKFHLS